MSKLDTFKVWSMLKLLSYTDCLASVSYSIYNFKFQLSIHKYHSQRPILQCGLPMEHAAQHFRNHLSLLKVLTAHQLFFSHSPHHIQPTKPNIMPPYYGSQILKLHLPIPSHKPRPMPIDSTCSRNATPSQTYVDPPSISTLTEAMVFC